LLPFRFFFQRKRSEIVIDVTTCEGKVIEVGNWKLLRTEKYVVHLVTTNGEKYAYIHCSQSERLALYRVRERRTEGDYAHEKCCRNIMKLKS